MMFILSRKAEELKRLRYHALQQERMATIGQISAGIAHEIGNPLASLFSLLEVLKASSREDEKTIERFDLMHESLKRISKTVRQIATFGRPIASEDWTCGDIAKIVLDTLHMLRYSRNAKNVTIMANFERRLPKTLVIEHQLQQVFMNIALNALEAMHGRGKLTVYGSRNNGSIEVAMSDTGEGMSAEQISHIFEPFYTTRTARKGTGLGLALSYNIVAKHGGTIRVQSEKGKGSTFVVSIPLRTANGGTDAPSPNTCRG